MNYFKYKNFIRRIRQITLSKEEQSYFRSQFIKDIGIDESSLPIHTFGLKQMGISFAILLFIIIAPITFAAEMSLPGDILYPIKTQVNERVERIINRVVSNDSTEFEVRLLEKKIMDVEKVITENKLNEKRKEKAKNTISVQIEKAIKVTEIENKQQIKDEQKIKDNPKTNDKQDAKKNDKQSEKVEEELLPEKNKKNDNSENNDSQGRKKLEEVLEKHKDTLKKVDLPEKVKSNQKDK